MNPDELPVSRIERVVVAEQVLGPEEIATLHFRLLLLRRCTRRLGTDVSRQTELAVLVGPEKNGHAPRRAGQRRVVVCLAEEQCRVILAERE
jgi:hypothetical protein